MSFLESTQRRQWLFDTEEALARHRTKATADYVTQRLRTQADWPPEFDGLKLQREQFLTASEEVLIARHFASQVPKLCSQFKPPRPQRVVQTASVFVMRYFLNNSASEVPPTDVFLGCVFLAGKAEEAFIKLADFVRFCGTEKHDGKLIKALEVNLIQGLKFNLAVFGPFRPLRGHLLDVEASCKPQCSGDKEDVWKQCKSEAKQLLWRWLATDVLFLFPPSQVAFAALHAASQKTLFDLSTYLDAICSEPCQREQLESTCAAVIKVADNCQLPDSETVEALLAKAAETRNPQTNPDHKLFEWAQTKDKTTKQTKRKAGAGPGAGSQDVSWITGIKPRDNTGAEEASEPATKRARPGPEQGQ
eukprot:m.222996 g.222996  ORF g.222996 m.222996 type:complete len:362 (-) comp18743_c1_seq2:65-1150(-)